jgi:dipeptidyl aminopeptidase/acylaminoacyl peptidase
MENQVYQRAESFLPWNLQDIVFNSTIFPYWVEDALYYLQQTAVGKSLLRIDLNTANKEAVLDYQRLLDALSHELKLAVDAAQLPLDKFSVQENPLRLYFTYEKEKWCYDLEKNNCFKEVGSHLTRLESPNKNWALWTKDYNLVLTDLMSHENFILTTDGECYYDYASSPETNTQAITQRLRGTLLALVALWSPDSSKIVTHKLDQRKVHELSLLQHAPEGSQRPQLHNYRMSFSGDAHLPLAELMIVDVITKKITSLKTEPLLSPYLTPLEFKWVWWSEDSKKLYFLRETRGSKELMLCVANTATGEVQTLITESAQTYVEPSQFFPCPSQVLVLENNHEIIWLSECSGYAHLYLYDVGSSTPKLSITHGEWTVTEVHFYDSKADWLYFTAFGYDKNIDPYYKQLYRCRLNGSEVSCLTEENANHSIFIAPNKKCFLDTYSTISTAPVSILKTMDGKFFCLVETADIQGLLKLNWVPPQRLFLKARDDMTSIYGNIYFPSHFDSNKKYPIIDHIYPGPQFYRTSPHFSLYGSIFRSAWLAQALAELGFIVIHIDGLGTPGRSKAFHDVTYQNMSDCSIPDHVAAIKQLAEKYSYIDLERIGVTGYSGGGYAAVRAMLMYPDFFKVGVAAAGNHDLRCYPASYGEKYNGLDSLTYAHQSNAAHADKLQGNLFLIHGEMDDNVHPCATFQLVDALIRHNKDFDMLIMPNQNHDSTFDHPYYMRKHWDYFVKHLLNQNPPKNYYIKPMPFDFPQLKDW